jgi:hypothetical protein
MSLPKNRSLIRRLVSIGALAALAVVSIAPGAMAAAPPPIRFSLSIGVPGDCIAVITDANLPTSYTLRSASGDLKAQGTLPADELFFCLGSTQRIEPGDKLRASDATYVRNFVIPNLSIQADRVADRFMGTGPAGRTLKVEFPAGLFADVGLLRRVRVDQDGDWTLNLHRDLIGGIGAAVSWKSPNDDRISAYTTTPFISINIGSSHFSGYGDPLTSVQVALFGETNGGAIVAVDPSGVFNGRIRTNSGNGRPVEVGDHFVSPSLGADADWIVPEIEGAADAATDEVTGRCHDTGNASGTAIVEDHRTGKRRGFAVINTEADGSFAFNFAEVGHFFANPANVKHGDKLVVRCLMATGDWVRDQFQVP